MSLKRGADAVNFTLLERTKRVKYVPSPEEIAREDRNTQIAPSNGSNWN